LDLIGSDSEAAKPGDVFRTVTFPYSTAIFVIVPIKNVVAAVLNGPVLRLILSTRCGSARSGILLVMPQAISREFLPLFFFYAVPLDEEGLFDVTRKVEVRVELRGCPDLSGFDSSMIGGRRFNEMRFSTIQILKNSWLVSFDGEMVVGLSLCDQIPGQLALRQLA
jgi:hypothetical protein